VKVFEVKEIANGWLICYATENGCVQRYFNSVDQIVDILRMIVDGPAEVFDNGTEYASINKKVIG
jgi:hypothetical protein